MLHGDNGSEKSDGVGNRIMLHLSGKGLKQDCLIWSWIETELDPNRPTSLDVRQEFFSSHFTFRIG